jgi:tetratricopeptide (TPR) repeat protein
MNSLIKKAGIATMLSMLLLNVNADAMPKLDKSTPLTEQLLDNLWQNREDTTNQKIIADYLLTEPTVPKDYATSWKLARLVTFIGNYGVGEDRFVSTSEGAKLFKYGYQAGEQAQGINPNGIEGIYWYAVDLGAYGLAKGLLSAAVNAKAGIVALQKAQQINPSYDGYGSFRILGRYYQELPGFLGGDKTKAGDLYIQAVTKDPTYRNNWVFLGQYYIKMKKWDDAQKACQRALSLPGEVGKYEDMRYTREAKECISKAHE